VGRAIFVTSPARGAGKTLVALAWVRALRRRGHRAIGVKPIDTACAPGADHDLLSIDGRHLQTVSGPPDVPYTVIAPYRLGSPLAPGLALAEAGLDLSLDELTETVRDAEKWGDVLVVEGPWSALAPLTAGSVALDLAKSLEARVVIVTDDAIEPTLETVAAVRARGLILMGIVVSRAETDAAALSAKAACPVITLGALTGDLEARVTAAETALEAWARDPFAETRPS